MLLPRMTTIFLLQLALSTVVFFAGSFRDIAQTKDPKPRPTTAEKSEKDEPAEDKIYSAKEVDVKAKVIRLLDDPPKPGADCPGRMRLVVSVRAVLRKSGKVTETKLVKESGCSSYDQDAIRAVSNVKFNPALKDNRPVSQYQVFEYKYSRF
ncbi:MAG: TonB family protein [Pyrinomonadaceae bacterium]